jgi:hypothetical protein
VSSESYERLQSIPGDTSLLICKFAGRSPVGVTSSRAWTDDRSAPGFCYNLQRQAPEENPKLQMIFPVRSSISRALPVFSKGILQRRTQTTASSFLEWRAATTRLHKKHETMATPTKIYLTVNDTGIIRNKPQNEETAAKTSKLLQENHEVSITLPSPAFPKRHK